MSDPTHRSADLDRVLNNLKGMNPREQLTVADILGLPEALQQFLRWIILNRAVTCEQVALRFGGTEEEACLLMNKMEELALTERLPICGMPRYWVRLSPRRLRPPRDLLNRDRPQDDHRARPGVSLNPLEKPEATTMLFMQSRDGRDVSKEASGRTDDHTDVEIDDCCGFDPDYWAEEDASDAEGEDD